MIATNVAEAGGFLKTRSVAAAPGHPAAFRHRRWSTTTRASCISATASPATSACCGRRAAAASRSQSADPLAAPRIDPDFLADPEDLEALVKGVEDDARASSRRRRCAICGGKELFTAGRHERRRDRDSHIRARADTDLPPGRHLPHGRRRRRRWSTRNCACAASRGCASSTPRSCRR